MPYDVTQFPQIQLPPPNPPAPPRQVGWWTTPASAPYKLYPWGWNVHEPTTLPPARPRQQGYQILGQALDPLTAPIYVSWARQQPDPLPAARPRQEGTYATSMFPSGLVPPLAWENQRLVTYAAAPARQFGYQVLGQEFGFLVAPFLMGWYRPPSEPNPPAAGRQLGTFAFDNEPTMFALPPILSWENQRLITYPPVRPRQEGFKSDPLVPQFLVPVGLGWDNQRPGPLPAALARQLGFFFILPILVTQLIIPGPWEWIIGQAGFAFAPAGQAGY
jgi:hypothetical protein